MKKGDIWISAALYFGLGIVVLSLILSAGLPVINKLRDKNIIIQTKEIMFNLDNIIRDVARGGAGEQRVVNLDIKKGQFLINNDYDTLNWTTEVNIQVSEIGIPYKESNIIISTEKSKVEGEFITTLSLDYSGIADINYIDPTQIVTGQNRLIIRNNGQTDTTPKQINITIFSA